MKPVSPSLRETLAGRDASCHACGYNLRDAADIFCSECGVVIPIPTPAVEARAGWGSRVGVWHLANSMTAATIGVACVTRFVNRPLGKAAFASTGLTFAAGFLVVAALLLHLMVGLRGRMLARAREGERRPVVFACVGTALLMAAVGCLVAG